MKQPTPADFIHFPIVPTPHVYIQYKGVFDMQDVYDTVADFFRQKKFKFYEIQQRHRRPSPFGAEILYQFRAIREVEDYYQWVVDVTIETFDLRDVDVVLKDGTKKKMTKGRLWVYIAGRVEHDFEKLWEKNAFLAHLKGFYHKYIINKKTLGIWWDELYYRIVLRLHALIKERLKMASEVSESRHMSGVH